MNKLEEIVAHKKSEVAEKKKIYTRAYLEKSEFFSTPCVSLKKYLSKYEDSFPVIAEFKRKSPSAGIINPYAKVEEITLQYMRSGACALSVLTDEKYFGAKKDDLRIARKWHYCPILMKDFFIDEFQILEAKSQGADVVLLIAKILSLQEIKNFSELARSLSMEVILEFFDEEDIRKCDSFYEYDVAGINSRNLEKMETDPERFFRFSGMLPDSVLKIAESGIKSPEQLASLKKQDCKGYLIGEYFLKTSHPGQACRNLILQAKSIYDGQKN